MIMKINHHEMEICLEAFDEEDLLVAIILGLHVFCTYKLFNSLEQFLITHLKFDKIIFQF